MADKIKHYARLSYNDEEPGVFTISITFPDIPGCFSCANTREEAIEMSKDALETWFDDEEAEYVSPSRLDEF